MKPKRKSGIFYGWWVVTACFLMAVYTSGVIGYSFTAFFEPIAAEFGWSYTSISLAASLRGAEVGLLSAVVGIMVDRFSAKPVLFGGGVLIGLGLLVFSRVNSLVMFYLSTALIAVGLSGCGATPMVAAVARWFRRKSGLTMGLMICGFGFSGFLVPVVVGLVDGLGWRKATVILAIGIFAVVVPLSLLVRHRPEDYGLLPDGDVADSIGTGAKQETSSSGAVADITVREIVRSRTFWHIAIALSAQFMLAGAIITHIMPYLSSIGISRGVASLGATGVPITSILGRFGFGYLADRIKQRELTAGGLGLMGLGILLFVFGAQVHWLLVPSITLFGIGFGGTNTMRAVISRSYFGLKNFATIFGFLHGIGAFGNMMGAPIAGFVYDKWHTYVPIWYIYAVVALVSVVIMETTPPAKTRAELRTQE
ncbi:MAG: MFS transporter [Chloroflexota bacterium]